MPLRRSRRRIKYFIQDWVFQLRIFRDTLQTHAGALIRMAVNRSAALLTAHFGLWVLSLLAKGIAGSRAGIPLTLFSGHLELPPPNWFWGKNHVIALYGTEAIFWFFSFLVGWWGFRFSRKRPGMAKVYFLWMGLLAWVQLFGGYLTGYFMDDLRGTAFLPAYLHIPEFIEMGLVAISALCLALAGALFAKSYLQVCPNRLFLAPENRPYYHFFGLYLPFLVLLAAYPLYRLYYLNADHLALLKPELFRMLPMVVALVSVKLFSGRWLSLQIRKVKELSFAIHWGWVGASLGLLVLSFLLSFGIRI